jgi:hypothetical protein
MLIVTVLIATNNPFKLSVIMLNVVMLNVVIQSCVVPKSNSVFNSHTVPLKGYVNLCHNYLIIVIQLP